MSGFTKGELKAVSCDGLGGWRICVETEGHQICGIEPGVSASGFLSKEEHLANATHIVKCWNSRDKLLEVCQFAFDNFDKSYSEKVAAKTRLQGVIAEATGK